MPKPISRKLSTPSPRGKKRKRKAQPSLAKEPDLNGAIERDIASLGLVGERDAGLLVYVVATSRLLDSPGAVVLRGPSGAGKTEVQRTPVSLIPDDAKIDVTTLTPNALYWMEEGSMSHKLLVTGERKHRQDDDAADANTALRQLLSEGRISKASPVKTSEGIQTQRIEQEGPVAYVETTTAKSIFAEDLNRMLQVYVDDSEEQTKAVMLELARAKAGGRSPVDSKAVQERHFEFQRALKPCRVVIPYAEHITLPAKKVEARRVFGQVLMLIEAVTLLHQFQRERDGDGNLIATLDDYAVARRLALGPIHAAVGLGKKYEKVRQLKHKLPSVFTADDVRVACGHKTKMGSSHLLSDLRKGGFLIELEKAQGKRPAKYEWAEEIESILPSVKTIGAAMGNGVTDGNGLASLRTKTQKPRRQRG